MRLICHFTKCYVFGCSLGSVATMAMLEMMMKLRLAIDWLTGCLYSPLLHSLQGFVTERTRLQACVEAQKVEVSALETSKKELESTCCSMRQVCQQSKSIPNSNQ